MNAEPIEFPSERPDTIEILDAKFELNRQAISYGLVFEKDQFEVTLRWPTPEAVRELIKQQKVSWRNDGDEIFFDPGDIRPAQKFLLAHVIGARHSSGKEFPAEQVKAVITKSPHKGWADSLILKNLLLVDRPDELAVNTDEDFDFTSLCSNDITIRVAEWINGRRVQIDLKHNLRQPTDTQVLNQRQALQFGLNQKQSRFSQQINPVVLTEIYYNRILSIDGATIDGQPCGEGNREAWAGEKPSACKVPYQWIHAVMLADTRGVATRSPF
jgi:hypothetical protein